MIPGPKAHHRFCRMLPVRLCPAPSYYRAIPTWPCRSGTYISRGGLTRTPVISASRDKPSASRPLPSLPSLERLRPRARYQQWPSALTAPSLCYGRPSPRDRAPEIVAGPSPQSVPRGGPVASPTAAPDESHLLDALPVPTVGEQAFASERCAIAAVAWIAVREKRRPKVCLVGGCVRAEPKRTTRSRVRLRPAKRAKSVERIPLGVGHCSRQKVVDTTGSGLVVSRRQKTIWLSSDVAQSYIARTRSPRAPGSPPRDRRAFISSGEIASLHLVHCSHPCPEIGPDPRLALTPVADFERRRCARSDARASREQSPSDLGRRCSHCSGPPAAEGGPSSLSPPEPVPEPTPLASWFLRGLGLAQPRLRERAKDQVVDGSVLATKGFLEPRESLLRLLCLLSPSVAVASEVFDGALPYGYPWVPGIMGTHTRHGLSRCTGYPRWEYPVTYLVSDVRERFLGNDVLEAARNGFLYSRKGSRLDHPSDGLLGYPGSGGSLSNGERAGRLGATLYRVVRQGYPLPSAGVV